MPNLPQWVFMYKNLGSGRGGGYGHLYFWVDIILLKGLSKHTLSMYFPSMKIDSNYAFLLVFFFPLIFSIRVFPRICKHDKKHILFSNFVWFCTPKRCTHVHRLVLANNPNYMNFFLRGWYQLQIQVPPPPRPGAKMINFLPNSKFCWKYQHIILETNLFPTFCTMLETLKMEKWLSFLVCYDDFFHL